MRWMIAVLGFAGCALPVHIPVSAAVGPNHVTYAYRASEEEKIKGKNDYLVDCKIDGGGNLTNCVTIVLEGGE